MIIFSKSKFYLSLQNYLLAIRNLLTLITFEKIEFLFQKNSDKEKKLHVLI